MKVAMKRNGQVINVDSSRVKFYEGMGYELTKKIETPKYKSKYSDESKLSEPKSIDTAENNSAY